MVVLFVSDFDGTLTKGDTTPFSFQSTIKYINANEKEKVELKAIWSKRSKAFYSGYAKLLKEKLDVFTANLSPGMKELELLLSCLDKYTIESRYQLAKNKYLDDIVSTNLQYVSNKIEFYPYALDVVSNLAKQPNVQVKILSVNWFPQLLSECFKGVLESDDVFCAAPPILNDNNELQTGLIATSKDKKEQISKWFNQSNTIVYIGDSITDLGALLEASYGIVFGDNHPIQLVIKLFGVKVLPLNEFDFTNSVNAKQHTDEIKTLYTSSDWKEVEYFVTNLVHNVVKL